MRHPRRFRLVVFDLDGVLVDTSPCHARAFAELWSAIGVEGPPYADLAGRPTREAIAAVTAARLPSPASLDAWTRRKQRRARALIAETPVGFDDTVPAITRLLHAGVRLAVGTAASRASAHQALARLGLGDAFAPVVTADDVVCGKPDPEVYLRALAGAGAAPAEALIVEDSRAGLTAAVTTGAWSASVRTGVRARRPRFLGAFPDLVTMVRALMPDGADLGGDADIGAPS